MLTTFLSNQPFFLKLLTYSTLGHVPKTEPLEQDFTGWLSLLSPVVKVGFNRWWSCAVYGEHGARAYSGGLQQSPQRGLVAKRDQGAKPPSSW